MVIMAILLILMKIYYPGESNCSDDSDGFRGSGEPGECGDYGKSVGFGYR